MTRTLAHGLDVRYNAPVTKVHYTEDGVEVFTHDASVHAAAVIVTVSCALEAPPSVSRWTPLGVPRRDPCGRREQ